MHKKRGPIITTIRQAKRLITVVIGFTIIAAGIVMLVTPGPGIPAIIIGLALLGTEFLWAKKLMKRFEHHANNVKNSFLNNYVNNRKK
ncbi:MAG: PGPGW domain-containing protein [Nitrospirota bacterium]|nr:PGPGW domain-containing protein [Nitrospirota bacterium]